MGKVFWDRHEIPCPPGASPNGGRVYVWRDLGGGKRSKLDIGRYARQEDNTFYPNNNFRLYFPDLWEEHYGDGNKLQHQLSIGLYALTLAIGHKTKLYPILYEVFGPLYGNALIDYAMYSLKERSNVAYMFKPCMAGNVIFSKDRNDDNWFSDLFTKKIDKENIWDFRKRWIETYKELNENTKVWVAIDGSNSDYHTKNSFLGSKGKAKSKKNVNIVSYMWAISEDGTPLTFFMNPGSTVDSKAFMEICTFLKAYDMDIQGVIIDKGFLTHDVLQLICSSGYDYLVNLKEDNYAHMNMHRCYAEEVFLNIRYLSGEDGRFGIMDGPIRLFEGYDDEAYVSLYYDNKNGPARMNTLFNKILKTRKEAEAKILRNEKPELTAEMKPYFTILEVDDNGNVIHETADDVVEGGGDGRICQTESADHEQDRPKGKAESVDRCKGSSEVSTSESRKKYKLELNDAKGKADVMEKGFGSLASSRKMSPEEMDAIYDIRDVSEKQYMAVKSMLGYEVFRAHDDRGTQSRELVCFISAIIRTVFENYCKKMNLKPYRILAELDEMVYLMLMGDGTYTFVDKPKNDVRRLLTSLGYGREEFELLTGDVNERIRAKLERNDGGVSQFHDEPYTIKERNQRRKRKKGKVSQEKKDAPKRGRGRPPGRKNNKTLEREAMMAANGQAEEPKPKRGRGRPPGRKNDKTLEREALEAAKASMEGAEQKRGRGRPKGSKDSKPRKRRTKAEMIADSM